MSKMQRKYTLSIIALFTLLFAAGCEEKEFSTKTFFTADTYFSVTLPQDKESLAEEAFKTAEKEAGSEGRGYAADKTAAFMKDNGINNFIINFGGNMYISGKKNGILFTAGIPNPQEPNRIISVIEVKNRGIATKAETAGREDALYASVSVAAENAGEAEKLAAAYDSEDKSKITEECRKNNTPVLIVLKDGKTEKLCGWEKLEVK